MFPSFYPLPSHLSSANLIQARPISSSNSMEHPTPPNQISTHSSDNLGEGLQTYPTSRSPTTISAAFHLCHWIHLEQIRFGDGRRRGCDAGDQQGESGEEEGGSLHYDAEKSCSYVKRDEEVMIFSRRVVRSLLNLARVPLYTHFPSNLTMAIRGTVFATPPSGIETTCYQYK